MLLLTSDLTPAEGDYTVRWHYPVENWTPLGTAIETAPTLYGSADGIQPANGQVNVHVQGKGEVDVSTGEKFVGGVLTTATLVFAPEVDPLLLGLAGAAGYTFSQASPPSDTLYTLYGTAGQLQTDVNTELSLASGNTSGIFMPSTARMDSVLADAIHASGDYNSYIHGNYGYLFFTGLIGQHRFTQDYTGDAYDSHGYSGPVDGIVKRPGGLEYVYIWTMSGGISGHG